MRLSIIRTIYKKEMLDLIRDRRALISMVVVPLVVFSLVDRGHVAAAPPVGSKVGRGCQGAGLRGARLHAFHPGSA
jgi:hypothetical protein